MRATIQKIGDVKPEPGAAFIWKSHVTGRVYLRVSPSSDVLLVPAGNDHGFHGVGDIVYGTTTYEDAWRDRLPADTSVALRNGD